MTATLDIHRANWGRLLLDHADEVALKFFTEDISSRDPDCPSYDERATSEAKPSYDEADTTAIRRGMRLNRAPSELWVWARNSAPVGLLADLPPDLDLIDAADDDFAQVREQLEAALSGFVAEQSGEWRRLAVATKIIHLKRPSLVPILDGNVLRILGVNLRGDAPHAAQVELGLKAIALIRREGRRNRDALAAIEAKLLERDLARSPARILDALLWTAY